MSLVPVTNDSYILAYSVTSYHRDTFLERYFDTNHKLFFNDLEVKNSKLLWGNWKYRLFFLAKEICFAAGWNVSAFNNYILDTIFLYARLSNKCWLDNHSL